jgi:hypothetical protein
LNIKKLFLCDKTMKIEGRKVSHVFLIERIGFEWKGRSFCFECFLAKKYLLLRKIFMIEFLFFWNFVITYRVTRFWNSVVHQFFYLFKFRINLWPYFSLWNQPLEVYSNNNKFKFLFLFLGSWPLSLCN